MTPGRRLILFIILALFSTQVLAGFLTDKTHSGRFAHSEKEQFLKAELLPSTQHLETGTRFVTDTWNFHSWKTLPAFGNTLPDIRISEKMLLAGFDLFKDFFLSPVHLIFPFQYFW